MAGYSFIFRKPVHMPDRSPALDLPYLLPSQAQKHVTHNDALQRLDTLVQLCVEGFDQATPPALPEEGRAYALGPNPIGVWAAQAHSIAVFQNATWAFITPQIGWRAFGRSEGAFRIWTGTTWKPPVPELDNLDHLGIGTSADAVNRLAVAADASLLSHDGAGHQLKVNKATPTDTASLLFQTGWSGRAEMGLAGNDDFALKVSADGAAWTTGLSVAAATGTVSATEMAVSGGVFLGGTAPGNRLAVYDSGVYTPDLIDTSGNAVALPGNETAYVRIGNQVTYFFNFLNNLDTTGLVASDDIGLTLPFTNAKHCFASVELRGAVGQPGPYHWHALEGQAAVRIRSLDINAKLTVADFTSGVTDIVGGTLTVTLA